MRPQTYLAGMIALGCLTLMAKDVWEAKSDFMLWTKAEVQKVLHDSPWVSRSSAGFMTISAIEPTHSRNAIPVRPTIDEMMRDPGRRAEAASPRQPIYYRICLLTAKPIREALLRQLTFPPNIVKSRSSQTTVHVDEIRDIMVAQAEQARLRSIRESYPDDIRVKGDDSHIIISLSIAMVIPQYQRSEDQDESIWWEDSRPARLIALSSSFLAPDTSLSTKTGKKMPFVRYEPPGQDDLGAKFYFSRKLPDGSPRVTMDDKELRFETRIEGKRVRAKFNLKKLAYRDRLQI